MTSAPGVDPTPDGVTDHYGIRYPLPGGYLRRADFEALAQTADAAMVQAVKDAANAVPPGIATQKYVDDKVNNVVTSRLTPAPSTTLNYSGGQVSGYTETLPDGTTNTVTVVSVAGQVASVTQTNPPSTTTLSYTGGVLTGVTIA